MPIQMVVLLWVDLLEVGLWLISQLNIIELDVLLFIIFNFSLETPFFIS